MSRFYDRKCQAYRVLVVAIQEKLKSPKQKENTLLKGGCSPPTRVWRGLNLAVVIHTHSRRSKEEWVFPADAMPMPMPLLLLTALLRPMLLLRRRRRCCLEGGQRLSCLSFAKADSSTSTRRRMMHVKDTRRRSRLPIMAVIMGHAAADCPSLARRYCCSCHRRQTKQACDMIDRIHLSGRGWP